MATNAEQNQIQNQQNQNQQQQQNQAPVTGGGAPQQQSRTASFSSGAQQGTSGSGRFTNLNKYLGANREAGSRMASGISSRVEQTNEPKKTEAQTQASNVRAGIEAGKQDLQKGQQLNTQLEGYVKPQQNSQPPAQSLENFANTNLNDITRMRQGVSTNQLSTDLGNAQAATQNYQSQLAERQKQLGSDTGRFGLLQETFGGRNRPTYGAGQQQLDNLFLQAGSGNKLNELNRSLIGQQQTTQADLSKLAGTDATNLQNLQTGYGKLATDLTGNLTTGLEGVKTAAEAQAEAVNTQRAADQKYMQEQFAALSSGQAVDQAFLDKMGINKDQLLLNVAKDPNFNFANYVNLGKAQLSGANELANVQQRTDYNALANLAGVDQANRLIQQGYTPEEAYKVVQGEQGLASQVSKANEEFDKYLTSGAGNVSVTKKQPSLGTVQQGFSSYGNPLTSSIQSGGTTASGVLSDLYNKGTTADQFKNIANQIGYARGQDTYTQRGNRYGGIEDTEVAFNPNDIGYSVPGYDRNVQQEVFYARQAALQQMLNDLQNRGAFNRITVK